MISELRTQSGLKTYAAPKGAAAPAQAEAKETFTPGEAPLPGKPTFAAQTDAEKPARTHSLGALARTGALGMLGLAGMMALGGCNNQPAAPAQVQTAEQIAAQTALDKQLSGIEDSLKGMPAVAGQGHKQSEQVTSQILNALRSYQQKAGDAGNAASQSFGRVLQNHPALVLTSAFALGAATGISLDRFGVVDSAKDGAVNIYDWVKANPLPAVGIGLAAGGVAYLLYNMASTEGAIPQKPTGEAAAKLDKTLSSMEDTIQANPNGDNKAMTAKFMDAISKYQKETGKAWDSVASDVKAFTFEHPILATTLVASAGVGVGVVLERSGVDAKVAALAGAAFQGAGPAATNAVNYMKEHPVVTGVVGATVAAGVGYLVYSHFNPAPAPAPAH